MDVLGFYFSAILESGTKLFLAQLTDEEADLAGLDKDRGGYFLYEMRPEEPNHINILAKIDTDEAAFSLSRMLNMQAA
jgi:hypothetical protein